MIDLNLHRTRRDTFRSMLPRGSLALLFSSPARIKSNDVEYPYRPDSDFFYMTGFAEEECILVLSEEKVLLYLRPRDPEKETWNGRRLGVERAAEILGVDEAKEIGSFYNDLESLLRNRSHLYYAFGSDRYRDERILAGTSELLKRTRAGESGPANLHHPAPLLHEMRLFKSKEEVELLRECARITGEAHREVMRRVRPGMVEYELEAILHYHFLKNGGREAYPSIVATGANACILHYTENNAVLRENDLILMDAGAEKQCMNADVTRTFPAGGRFSPAQRDLYRIVLEAQAEAIRLSVPGNTMETVHNATLRILVEGLRSMGLLKGNTEEAIEKGEYRRFYMHRTGHWLGMDVHDVGLYHKEGSPRPLAPGMVCTVEPGLYIPDAEDIPPELRGTGIRIEDDVLVRDGDPEILTLDIPKEISQIESLRS